LGEDWLPNQPEEWAVRHVLAKVLVFARVAGREGTLARRLGDLPHFGEVAERRGVDQLFASGWLERAL